MAWVETPWNFLYMLDYLGMPPENHRALIADQIKFRGCG